jgi:ATP-dependent Clp protease ATP-binding subunit ClpA
MFERFTDNATIVLLLTQCAAKLFCQTESGPEHILLGLIAERYGGLAGSVLRTAGLTIQGVRSEMEDLFEECICDQSESFAISSDCFFNKVPVPLEKLYQNLAEIEIPFSGLTKKALQLAWDEAAKMDANHIDTEHLLLGLLSLDEGRHLNILRQFNIDIEVLTRAIRLKIEGLPGGL